MKTDVTVRVDGLADVERQLAELLRLRREVDQRLVASTRELERTLRELQRLEREVSRGP